MAFKSTYLYQMWNPTNRFAQTFLSYLKIFLVWNQIHHYPITWNLGSLNTGWEKPVNQLEWYVFLLCNQHLEILQQLLDPLVHISRFQTKLLQCKASWASLLLKLQRHLHILCLAHYVLLLVPGWRKMVIDFDVGTFNATWKCNFG